MATPDNERYLRHLSLLGNVGLLVFRDIVARKASKRRQTLDEILDDNRNRFRSNREHFCELFPQGSVVNADITTWSMSLLFLVIKELFWNDLSCDDRSSLRTLRNLRDEVDGTQVSLTEDEYATNRADIKQAFKKLKSGLSKQTQERIQDAINSSWVVVIDVQTTLQQIRELGEYTPSMLDDLDSVFNTVTLASAHAENRCHNTQDRAPVHGRDSSEIKLSSSFEKLTTTGGRDENVFEIYTSEHSLAHGENVQDATFFEDLKTVLTEDDNLQAVHETASEYNRDSHEVKDQCRGEISSNFEELKPAGIKTCNEMTMPKRVFTCNPGGQENLETVESVNGNVTVNRDRELAVIPSERQSSGTTEESYDHLTDVNLIASAHDPESPECPESNLERGISSEQDFSSSGIRAFVSNIENGQSIQETQQSSHQDSVQVGSAEWLDPNGDVNLHITQMMFQSPETEDRNEEHTMIRAFSGDNSTAIIGMIRDMVFIQKHGGQRLRDIWIDLQIHIMIESNNPNLADGADHALCRIINEILMQINLVDAQQETHAGTMADACPTQQETHDGAQHNSYLAVTNSVAESATACPTQQGAENFLSERATSRGCNVSDIVERIMSNLAGDIERNPELVRLCFELLLRLSQLGGVYLMSAGKGCVLLLIKCKSFEAMVELLNFFVDDSFQEILDNIARTLESQRGGEIRIRRELTQESFENLESTIEEEFNRLPKERMGLLRTKCAGPADVFRISRYLQTDGKDICEQIQIQLSRLVGGEVSLSMHVGPLDEKQALDSTPDLTDLIGALIPRRTTTQRRIAV